MFGYDFSQDPTDIWYERPQEPAGIDADPRYDGDQPDAVVKRISRHRGTDFLGRAIPTSEWDAQTQTLTYRAYLFNPQTVKDMQTALSDAKRSGKDVKYFCVWISQGEQANPNLFSVLVRRWGFVKDSLAGDILTFTKDLTQKPMAPAPPPADRPTPPDPLSLEGIRDAAVEVVRHSRACGIFPNDVELMAVRNSELAIVERDARLASPEILALQEQADALQSQIDAKVTAMQNAARERALTVNIDSLIQNTDFSVPSSVAAGQAKIDAGEVR